MSADAGSVWWAELLLGLGCWLAAGLFGLALTSVGPFARIAVVYPTALAVVYLVVAVGFAATFVLAGVRRSPYTIGSEVGKERPTPEGGVVSQEGKA